MTVTIEDLFPELLHKRQMLVEYAQFLHQMLDLSFIAGVVYG